MYTSTFEYLYRKVPEQARIRLKNFRETHPFKEVTVEGITWHYLDSGQGNSTLLLLPGGLRVPDAAYDLIEALEKDLRIISPAYPSLKSATGMVDGLAAILDREHIPMTHVFGASYGGAIAQFFLLKFPERVVKLILANTGVSATPQEVQQLHLLLPVLRKLPAGVLRVMLKTALLRLISKSVSPEQLAFWQAFMQELFSFRLEKADYLSHFEVALDAGENWQIRPEDFRVKPGQVLIIESVEDVIKPQEQVALRAQFPQAQVYTFQEAGHTPWISQPEEYLKVIKSFLVTDENLAEQLPEMAPVSGQG